MGIGLSGMVSGLDTDAIVKAMVSGQQAKATKIENKITLNKWTKDVWSDMNSKIYNFYTKYSSKLRLQTSYMTKTANSSNEGVAKVTGSSAAAVGTHKLQVLDLASSQYLTSKQLATKDTYNKNTKLSELGVSSGTIFTITSKAGTLDEETIKLEVTDKTTINDFTNACKDAGLTASFDTGQQRFFISSNESGLDNKFSITANSYNTSNGVDISASLKEIEGMVNTSFLSTADKDKYQDAVYTLRSNAECIYDVVNNPDPSKITDKKQKEVYNAIETVKIMAEKTYKDQTAKEDEDAKLKQMIIDGLSNPTQTLSGTSHENYTSKYTYNSLYEEAANAIANKPAQDAVKDVKVESGYYSPAKLTKAKISESYNLLKEKLGTDTSKYIESKIPSNIDDETKAKLKEAISVYNTCEIEIKDADGNSTGVTVKAKFEQTYQEAVEDAKDDGVLLSKMEELLKTEQKTTYDKNVAKGKEIISKLDEDTYKAAVQTFQNKITKALKDAVTTVDPLDPSITSNAITTSSSSAMNKLGLCNIVEGKVQTDAEQPDGMALVEAADARIILDNAEIKNTSNNFTVNGISFNLISKTEPDEEVQITVGKDTESIYKMIKEALTEYNNLIEEMNTAYNATSAKGYEPLTDEQKESMSEKDIENWEKKIKDSLLRRDDTLGTLLSSMRNALASSYTDKDGKQYSLSTYGIVTGHYTEKGKLHIYGDEEDATYATYSDRLKAALEDDPDKVMETLTHVFGNLYSTMTEKCAKTEISSALTFYNDKQYNNLLKDYEDDLDILEDRIKELEDRYYKQFTAMEKAMSTLQNQSNSLASLLGTGQ